jgi:hypothetical protein
MFEAKDKVESVADEAARALGADHLARDLDLHRRSDRIVRGVDDAALEADQVADVDRLSELDLVDLVRDRVENTTYSKQYKIVAEYLTP